MALPVRPLGRSGMRITPVGLGTWAFGGSGWPQSWGRQEDADSIATIRHAVDQGINWIDTAPVYGFGHAEKVVGRALAGLPENDRPYVFTKCGVVWDGRAGAEPLVGNPRSIRREVEDSLRRLGVDRIDLCQMHWPARDGTRLEEYWRTLADLRAEGKIRAAGVSNHTAAHLESMEAIGHVDSLQPAFSLLRRQSAADIAWCAGNGTGVIVYSPLQSGLLSGRFSPERAASLTAEDWRSRDPDFRMPRLARNLALVDALRPIARRRGAGLAAVAVAWTLAWPGTTGAIVGARRPGQLADWLPAATLRLDDEELTEIAAAIDRTGAGEGPVRPHGTPRPSGR
ncbi:aldo/keto reductase [Actinomadura viridis]|uniref:Aryl-alcohol dehydrogenase-like predicted oxidoreductase n=1 Tax=Actinomadura viridis TaxID=58110 RepID=A0A931DKV4_9ACTN|nr:aldo/keto reductase [Actinomadura viridis]MBG6090564.1 aryl-alcohol dehydrogenase-like predicted oxidoreductase [Actinomadura viridis]